MSMQYTDLELIENLISKIGKLKKKMFLNMIKILFGKKNQLKKRVITETEFIMINIIGLKFQLIQKVYHLFKNIPSLLMLN